MEAQGGKGMMGQSFEHSVDTRWWHRVLGCLVLFQVYLFSSLLTIYAFI